MGAKENENLVVHSSTVDKCRDWRQRGVPDALVLDTLNLG